jgi:hypothetical protein
MFNKSVAGKYLVVGILGLLSGAGVATAALTWFYKNASIERSLADATLDVTVLETLHKNDVKAIEDLSRSRLHAAASVLNEQYESLAPTQQKQWNSLRQRIEAEQP